MTKTTPIRRLRPKREGEVDMSDGGRKVVSIRLLGDDQETMKAMKDLLESRLTGGDVGGMFICERGPMTGEKGDVLLYGKLILMPK